MRFPPGQNQVVPRNPAPRLLTIGGAGNAGANDLRAGLPPGSIYSSSSIPMIDGSHWISSSM